MSLIRGGYQALFAGDQGPQLMCVGRASLTLNELGAEYLGA
jgi:hypothetical protein